MAQRNSSKRVKRYAVMVGGRFKGTFITRSEAYAVASELGGVVKPIEVSVSKLKTNPRRKRSDPRRFTKKANTPKKRRQWKHVYRSEKRRGLSKARAIRAADSVLKRETLQRNPRKRFIIEAVVRKGSAGVKFMFWDDPGQRFTATRAHASPYTSEAAARIEAKKLVPRLPHTVIGLRTVPA